MLAFLPIPIRGVITAILLVLNVVLWSIFLYPLIFLKFVIPNQAFRRLLTLPIVKFAENWVTCNDVNLYLFQKIHFDIEGVTGLDKNKSYLVCSNHQSWVDILMLQHALNRRIPFMRFFVKQELAYIPLLGGIWWALDFPFMKRYSREYLEKHPEKRGTDLKTTKAACEKFRGSRICVLNFLEGTRLTPSKFAKQKSPFKNLLSPKSGGIAFVLEAMGTQFDSLIDVTLVYPKGAPTMMKMCFGQLPEVIIRVRKIPIPKELLQGDYLNNSVFRESMQNWVREIWEHKDRLIDELKSHLA